MGVGSEDKKPGTRRSERHHCSMMEDTCSGPRLDVTDHKAWWCLFFMGVSVVCLCHRSFCGCSHSSKTGPSLEIWVLLLRLLLGVDRRCYVE